MIDHLMTFANEADAQADSVVGTYYVNGMWRGDICIPGARVTVISTGLLYDANWRIMISKPTQDMTLSALSSCHLVTNRDLASKGPAVFVIQSILTQQQLAALDIEPTFMGSNYPFGT